MQMKNGRWTKADTLNVIGACKNIYLQLEDNNGLDKTHGEILLMAQEILPLLKRKDKDYLSSRPLLMKSHILKSLKTTRKVEGYKEIPGSYWKAVKIRSADRKRELSITIKEAWELFIKQNRTCPYSGRLLFFKCKYVSDTTASLDRIDSTKGYTLENVQWVHKHINIMKWDFPEKVFLDVIKDIYLYKLKN